MSNEDFTHHVEAGYSLLWVQTHEEDRAIKSLSDTVRELFKGEEGDDKGDQVGKCFAWDIMSGMNEVGKKNSSKDKAGDPLKAIEAAISMPESSVLFVKDFHKMITSVEVYRTIKNAIPHLRGTGKTIVFISPKINIPIELEKDITIFPFALPTVDDLIATAAGLAKETQNLQDVDIDRHTIGSGRGLTTDEAENCFALSLIQKKGFDKGIIEGAKLQAVKKSGLMEIFPAVSEKELGGMDNLKKYVLNRKRGFEEPDKYPSPKGILLLGLPGSGKSLSAKVTASVLGYPLIKLDIAALKGSLVGESERKMRQATEIIDAISPCVVWIDEIEKSLAGVQSSGRTDGGTTSAMFGHLLTWMQESTAPKYLVATCNDIEELMSISQGALLRRFDDIFWVDVPTMAERGEILTIMKDRYKLDDHEDVVNAWDPKIVKKMNGWTGAEIEKFAKACVYDGFDVAFKNIQPISKQNETVISKARDWASTNARCANTEKVAGAKKTRKMGV